MKGLFRRPSALLPLVLMVTATIVQSLIDPRSPSVARGIIGETAELACATTHLRNDFVSWVRRRDNLVVSMDRTMVSIDPRFSVRTNEFENTWFLDIQDSNKEDEGEYMCTVIKGTQKEEKKVKLTMIEASDTLRWRPDSKCGSSAALHGVHAGQFAECDPQGAYPCCSAGGWCGFSRHHCDCSSCVDYRPTEPTTTPRPAPDSRKCADGYREVSSKCLLYSDDPKTWAEATQFCTSRGGALITFETLDELMQVVGNLTKTEIDVIASLSPGVPVWVGVKTQGHKDPAGTVHWRWVMGRSELKDASLLKHLDATVEGERCGYLSTGSPVAILRHTGDCDKVLLPLCEQSDD